MIIPEQAVEAAGRMPTAVPCTYTGLTGHWLGSRQLSVQASRWHRPRLVLALCREFPSKPLRPSAHGNISQPHQRQAHSVLGMR